MSKIVKILRSQLLYIFVKTFCRAEYFLKICRGKIEKCFTRTSVRRVLKSNRVWTGQQTLYFLSFKLNVKY